jgi:hypothetical protein
MLSASTAMLAAPTRFTAVGKPAPQTLPSAKPLLKVSAHHKRPVSRQPERVAGFRKGISGTGFSTPPRRCQHVLGRLASAIQFDGGMMKTPSTFFMALSWKDLLPLATISKTNAALGKRCKCMNSQDYTLCEVQGRNAGGESPKIWAIPTPKNLLRKCAIFKKIPTTF